MRWGALLCFGTFLNFPIPVAFAQGAASENETSSSEGVTGGAAGQGLQSALDTAWEKRATYSASVGMSLLRSAGKVDDFSTLVKAAKLAAYFGNFGSFPVSRQSERQDVLALGVSCADKAKRIQPARVEGYYWYSANLAALNAIQGVFSVLMDSSDIKNALNEAVRIDPSYHFAGPLRLRGRLAFKLPFWFSFGAGKQSFADLKKANELAPEYRVNLLFFAEVLIENDSVAQARKLLESAKNLNTGLTGNELQRLEKLQAELLAKVK